MCGIVAIHAYGAGAPPVDRDELRTVRDAMAARGPDGHGEWFDRTTDGSRVGLGHRRLAIIDLSERGAQPMVSASGRSVIVFNGEIYNWKALRRELEERDRVFASASDTEVLLHLYEEQGESMVRKLRGMFAFVLWDARRGALFMARDPYGIKPLYVADDGATARVASQVRALLAGGRVSRAPDPAGIAGFFVFGSVPEPCTSYHSVRALPAGTFAWIDERGWHTAIRHFSVGRTFRDARSMSPPPPDELAATVRTAMRDSVAHHLVADVPVGAFLSAGVDSGALVGLMRNLGQDGIVTTTLAYREFAGTPEDESQGARDRAASFGTTHTTRTLGADEFAADAPRVLAAMDQPSIDGFNTWFVCKASPFLKNLIATDPELVERIVEGSFEPVFVAEAGAYPLSVAALGYAEIKRETISIALTNFYDLAIPARRLEIERSRLLTQLKRVQLAREVTIADLESAQDAAGRAHIKQRMGELILAYRGQVRLGDRELKAHDYDGSQLIIPLDPELDPIANSNAYFARAKKAKSRAGLVVEQLARHRADLEVLNAVIERAEGETSLRALEELREQAAAKRWLMVQRLPMEKEDRPFEGKKIREMLGPGGWRILVGENAEANDYLTLRVAKPDDWWLHVRGAVSAHVIIPTQRQPDKVPKHVIDFAAKVAVKHSGQKHASFVPVDITLRRYVRRIKGGAAGTVLYTHERTIHVDAKAD